ncbi:LacI family DNA-binding transcriptional regulator [Streptomyces sviceus]|uniref:LacI family DNA-binding transcriptional regulator n=1 Tax=Streptomyces sviceus TaxID=285530 RepID=UPI00381DA181
MGATIADVAARAGVSRTTVSRVLNGQGEIHENTVVKVRKAISEFDDDRFQRPGFPYVATTNREGGEQAARHVLDLGRRHPLVVTGPEEYGCAQERLRGFVEVYAQAGIELDPRSVIGGDSLFDSARSAIARALAEGLNSTPSSGATTPRRPARSPPCTRPAFVFRRMSRGRRPVCCSTTCADRRRPPPQRIIPTRLVIRGSTSQPSPD